MPGYGTVEYYTRYTVEKYSRDVENCIRPVGIWYSVREHVFFLLW